MKRLRANKKVQVTVAGLLMLFVLTGAYLSLRYTVVAGALESFSSVNKDDPIAYGAVLFGTRGCAGCHSLQKAGSGGDTGPNLNPLQGQNANYIRTSIVAPAAVVAPVCPEGPCEAGVMPNYGNILNGAQVDALVVYLRD